MCTSTNRMLFCLCFLLLSGPASAAFSVLSGYLDSAEPQAPIQLSCGAHFGSRNYAVVSPITVTASGRYTIAGIYAGIGIDVYTAVYEGDIVPADPAINRIAELDEIEWTFDGFPLEVDLQQGVEYQLLVASWCSKVTGTWSLAVQGPGMLQSTATRHGLDEFTSGSFSGDDPTADFGDCGGLTEYQQSGPHRVSRSGLYYLIDASLYFYKSVCVHVYTAPFDPEDPAANRISVREDFWAHADLQTGQDYWFVVQPRYPEGQDEYLYVIAPPGGVSLDASFTGSWYDPATPGQGFFLEVIPQAQQVFLGWFTYDLERPGAAQAAMLGDAGHRWLTAIGPYDGPEAQLDIEVTTGGVFNQPTPRPQQVFDGTIDLSMQDCHSGTIQFDLGLPGRTGIIPIERLAGVSADSCEYPNGEVGPPRRVMTY